MNSKKRYSIEAVRNYYSLLEFDVFADSVDEAKDIARKMIDDCQVEFDGIDCSDELDVIEAWEVKE